MGGHGGLNILPQKKWNVYNFDNREKVRKDEDAAAKEEQLKREQSRKRDAEFRLELLRQARGVSSTPHPHQSSPLADSRHINLFEGLKDFSTLAPKEEAEEERSGKRKREERKEERKKETVVVSAEDEKYRMGYGLVGKGVKTPWYLAKPVVAEDDGEAYEAEGKRKEKKSETGGKNKTIEELREERIRREKREKKRERVVLASAGKGRHGGVSDGYKMKRSRFS